MSVDSIDVEAGEEVASCLQEPVRVLKESRAWDCTASARREEVEAVQGHR